MTDLRAGAEILDRPEVLGRLLFPHAKDAPDLPDAVNHFIRVAEDARVGCRFFRARKDGPNILIHGEADRIIPVEEGMALYALSGARERSTIFLPNSGHNDLMERSLEPYMEGLVRFIQGKSEGRK